MNTSITIKVDSVGECLKLKPLHRSIVVWKRGWEFELDGRFGADNRCTATDSAAGWDSNVTAEAASAADTAVTVMWCLTCNHGTGL